MKTVTMKVTIKVLFASVFFLSAGVFSTEAWTGPTTTPPTGNVNAPLNVSSVTQTKNGALRAYGIRSFLESYFDGNVGIGTLTPTANLDVVGTVIARSGSGGAQLQLQTTEGGVNYNTTNSMNAAGTDLVTWHTRAASTWFHNAAGENTSIFGSTIYTKAVQSAGAVPLSLGANYATYMTILPTGNVGIGETSPTRTLQVNGSVGAESFFYTSDRNLKKNIKPLNNSLDKILSLEGVSFNWKEDGKASVGVIAQDVEKVYPELVSTDPISGLKSVEYGNLVAPLIEAIKEQQKQIDDLRAQVVELKAQRN